MPFLYTRKRVEMPIPDGMMCDRCNKVFNDPACPEDWEPHGVMTYHTEEGDELSVYCSMCYESIVGVNTYEPTKKLEERDADL